MELYSFDANAGHQVDRFGSDFVLSPLMKPTDAARTVCMHLPPGGLVGEHEATSVQLFCVVSGEGWVSGGDGERRAIKTHEAASFRWPFSLPPPERSWRATAKPSPRKRG